MTTPDGPTIYAVATPPGCGGVAIVRVSGPRARTSLAALTQGHELPPPRCASLRTIYDPSTGKKLDRAMLLFFQDPESFTGEDVVEYHLHGGLAVVEGVLKALAAQQDHRLAQPGEFTRRAFENGKMDLTAAEGLGDLIAAETQAQREQALIQMEGGLFRLYEGWREKLLNTLALMEADLDFSDQDLPDDILLRTRPGLAEVRKQMEDHLSDARRGERLRNGFQLVILGAPNAGKSTLMNCLAKRDVAIVSSVPGTTRDVIEAHLNIGGYPLILADTAGLRERVTDQGDHEKIEGEGIRRARERARHADLKILLFDGTAAPDPETLSLSDENAILVTSKQDLGTRNDEYDDRFLPISAQTGAGIEALLDRVATGLSRISAPSSAFPSPTRARHREAIERARDALARSEKAPLPELASEDVRLALRALGEITGKVGVEEILDKIFRDFCIGK